MSNSYCMLDTLTIVAPLDQEHEGAHRQDDHQDGARHEGVDARLGRCFDALGGLLFFLLLQTMNLSLQLILKRKEK